MKRLWPLLLLVALLPGCGTKSSGSGLDTALSYVPKDAPLVVAIDTDPDGDQWQQVEDLLGKFPFGGQAKEAFKNGFNANSGGIDYEKDFKPLLGDDLVVAISTASGLRSDDTPFVLAWKVHDEDAAKRLVQRNSSKVGEIDGADVYGTGSENFGVVKDGVLVVARTQPDLEAAVKRAGGGDHLTEDDFDEALGDLDHDGLLRVTGDAEAIIAASPDADTIRKVKWLGALRTFGAVLSAEDDGIAWGVRVKTEGSLTDADLPLAAGSQSAPVVRRAGEIGVGVRNLAQIVKFGEATARATDPSGYARYARNKAKTGRQLGIDIDRDVIGQLTGNAAVSIALNGDFAARADLKDPAAAERTLATAAPRLEKVAKDKSLGLSTPKGGKGFYALAQANGKKVVFGVVGKTFVVATDAARAAQFAGQSPSTISGAHGALVVASDARALANAIAEQQGQGVGARIVTGALGDLVGSLEAETSGLSGDLKLEIK